MSSSPAPNVLTGVRTHPPFFSLTLFTQSLTRAQPLRPQHSTPVRPTVCVCPERVGALGLCRVWGGLVGRATCPAASWKAVHFEVFGQVIAASKLLLTHDALVWFHSGV